MPSLPTPPLAGGVPLSGGDLPVSSQADVAAVWDEQIQSIPTAPVRDVIQVGQTALMLAAQRATTYAAAQSDPLRATDEYLDEIGNERDINRQPGEAGLSYSARVNSTPPIVDPNDIIAAVNAILLPFTSISARYSERSDGYFVNDGTASWSSHVFDGTANQPPNYPDRRYVGTTAAGVQAIPDRRPGGARVFDDLFGRYFEIRIPDLSPVDQSVAAAFDGTENYDVAGAFFVGDGTETVLMTYVWDNPTTEFAIYDQVINTVEGLRGHGIRWTLLVDPQLVP